MIVKMELTLRIYNAYSETLNAILNAAGNGSLRRAELYALAQNSINIVELLSIYEYLTPSGTADIPSPTKETPTPRPASFTNKAHQRFLKKSWLKTILSDPRATLLVPQHILTTVQHDLADTAPFFPASELASFRPLGDPFTDESYRQNIQTLSTAIQQRQSTHLRYLGTLLPGRCLPLKLAYIPSKDRLRLLLQQEIPRDHPRVAVLSLYISDITGTSVIDDRLTQNPPHTTSAPNTFTSNIHTAPNTAHDILITPLDTPAAKHHAPAARTKSEPLTKERAQAKSTINYAMCGDYMLSAPTEPLILEITGGRRACERCRSTLAKFSQRSEYDPATRTATCMITYQSPDEETLIAHLRDITPPVRVISPLRIAGQLHTARLRQQELAIYGGRYNPIGRV